MKLLCNTKRSLNMDEAYDELMGPSRKNLRDMLGGDQDPTMMESEEQVIANMTPSRWASQERDSETMRNEAHEANCKAVELAAEKVAANTPPRKSASVRVPHDYESDEGAVSDEYGWENDEQIRAEALRMLNMADEWHSGPYTVRKTSTGGFSSSFTEGSSSASQKKKHVPKALAGLDFTKRSGNRALYASGSRSWYNNRDEESAQTYKEEDNLVGAEESETKKESKWSSRYSIDHTLLTLSSGKAGGAVKDVLDRMDRDGDREYASARNMYMTNPHETKIFGSGGFGFRENHVFGKQNVTVGRQTNLYDLNSDGKSLPPPEPRAKTWEEQVKQKKRQQRRIGMACFAICAVVVVIIIVTIKKRGGSSTQASAFGTFENRGTPEVVFYVTSDSPYDSTEEQKLSKDLKALPGDAGFIVHLGNIQNSAVTLCSESRYSRVKSLLVQSPVPMFVLPGEEDWNNCPSPESAWKAWETNFQSFESNFEHNFLVNRQLRRKENFAFVSNEVLFMGFHLVSGRVNSRDEWNKRMEDNINWLESMVTMNQEDFSKIIMFGNARPGPQQRKFFDRLSDFLGAYEIPIIYIHANSGVGGVMQYKIFGRDQGIEGLQIEDGGQNPPMRISVYEGGSPFVVGFPVE